MGLPMPTCRMFGVGLQFAVGGGGFCHLADGCSGRRCGGKRDCLADQHRFSRPNCIPGVDSGQALFSMLILIGACHLLGYYFDFSGCIWSFLARARNLVGMCTR